MKNMSTIFSSIIKKEIPAKIEYEDDLCIVFHDKFPKAPVHLLIVPKKEIATIMDAEDQDQALLGHLVLVARDMGKKMNLEGYRLQFNVGQKGGQEIFHIHLHLMG
jgi:histidine triad (HIT) family protein